jgi:hypothetical protein
MLRRVIITNYLGISALDLQVPPEGILIEGGNAKGKSTFLKAIRAALAGRGIDAEAIRKGATSAEILIDLDHVSVKRVITQKGSSLTVMQNGVRQTSPQGLLNNLLGAAPLDPIELFRERDPDKRKEQILKAFPVPVTASLLLRWAPGLDADALVHAGLRLDPEFIERLRTPRSGAADEPLPGHGLEVLARVRKVFEARRTDANRTVKERRVAADQASAFAAAQGKPPADPEDVLLEQERTAKLRVAEAEGAAQALLEQEREAEVQEARHRTTRERIAGLRAEAEALRSGAEAMPTQEERQQVRDLLTDASTRSIDADAKVADLEEQLRQARIARNRAEEDIARANRLDLALTERASRHASALHTASERERTAADLEQAIGGAPAAPSEAEVQAAVAARKAAQEAETAASRAILAAQAHARARAAAEAQAEAEFQAERLAEHVRALRDDAPSALLASAGVEGLQIDGDAVTIFGTPLDSLCGAEQITFAVDVARALNRKSKLIVVDELERLDPETLKVFIARATEGGYQVVATRVTSGDFHASKLEGGVS